MEQSKAPTYLIQVISNLGFYSIKSILVLYFTQDLLMSTTDSLTLFSGTMALAFFVPFIGSLFGEQLVSRKFHLLSTLCLATIGVLMIALSSAEFLPLGLACFIGGAGLCKPIIPLLLEDFYTKYPHERERGYVLLYGLKNFGHLVGIIGCGFLSVHFGFTSGVSMGCLSTILTLFMVQRLIPNSPGGTPFLNIFLYFVCVVATILILWGLISHIDLVGNVFSFLLALTLLFYFFIYLKSSKDERKSVLHCYLFALAFCIFATVFEQTAGSITLFIDQKINRVFLGNFAGSMIIPTSVFQALSPFFVILLSLWMGLGSTQKQPVSLRHYGLKLSFGFLASAIGFLVFLVALYLNPEEEKGSSLWVVLAYVFLTIGEMSIAPLCLSVMTKLAPPRYKSQLVALWFIAAAYGKYLSGLIANLTSFTVSNTAVSDVSSQQLNFEAIFIFSVILCLISSAVILGSSMPNWLRNRRNYSAGINPINKEA